MTESVLITIIICITVILICPTMSRITHKNSEQTITNESKFNELMNTMASRGATSEELQTFNFLYVKYIVCQRKENDDGKMESKDN